MIFKICVSLSHLKRNMLVLVIYHIKKNTCVQLTSDVTYGDKPQTITHVSIHEEYK